MLENVNARQEGGAVLFTLNRASRLRPDLRKRHSVGYHTHPASLNALAQRLFGFSALHDFQHKIICRVLEGRNTLGIAATASGKTECFLLPALLLPGLTVVVSPLKSLMQDQWSASERYGLGALTTYLNGDVEYGERHRRLRGMREGRYKLAYFTPEQLARHHVRAALQRTVVSVLAIDEAHCVSQWGHDFRPDYLNMVRRLRGCWERTPVIVALTATASERVRRDLCDSSRFTSTTGPSKRAATSFFTEPTAWNSIWLSAWNQTPWLVAGTSSKTWHPSPVPGQPVVPSSSCRTSGPMVRASNRANARPTVEPFAAWLERQLGQRVAMYHGQMGEGLQTIVGTFVYTRWKRPDNDWGVYIFKGVAGTFCGVGCLRGPTPGMSYTMVGRWEEFEKYGRQFLFETCVGGDGGAAAPRPLGNVTGRDRRAEQRTFMSSENRIMVATKSFGMGIDKADIRLVIHHSPPGDLLSYAQEVGRAARDGNRGRVILYYTEGSYPGSTGYSLTDRSIQEWFLEGRYVRESDLRCHRFPARLYAAAGGSRVGERLSNLCHLLLQRGGSLLQRSGQGSQPRWPAASLRVARCQGTAESRRTHSGSSLQDRGADRPGRRDQSSGKLSGSVYLFAPSRGVGLARAGGQQRRSLTRDTARQRDWPGGIRDSVS